MVKTPHAKETRNHEISKDGKHGWVSEISKVILNSKPVFRGGRMEKTNKNMAKSYIRF